jgi:hypothetical protein
MVQGIGIFLHIQGRGRRENQRSIKPEQALRIIRQECRLGWSTKVQTIKSGDTFARWPERVI